MPITREKLEYLISIEVSRARRERWRRWRKATRILGGFAAIGSGLLIYYVTRPFPVEEWYIGLAGVALVVPYLVIINERVR